MSDYDSLVSNIKKYNEEACNNLYQSCSALKKEFDGHEESAIKEIRKITEEKINEIQTTSTKLKTCIKAIVETKINIKSQAYEIKMKEYKIF